MDDLFLQEMASRRQRVLADILRKQAVQEQYVGAPGQMISGRYVAPSWAQSLNQGLKPVAADRQATQQEAIADAGDAQYQQGLNKSLNQWQSALPQAVKAIPERQGPVDPGNPDELSAIPGQPVTTGQILKHTLQGLRIPGNEKAATIYNQGAMAELTREDTQQFRKEEAAATRAAALQRQIDDRKARLDELTLKLEDKNLDRAQKEVLATRHDDLVRQLTEGTNELKRMAIKAKATAAATAKAEKPVPTPVMKILSGLEQQAEGLSNVNRSYKSAYAGGWGAVDRLSGTWNPFSGKESEAAASWWKDYENQAALVERHEKFGTALSAGEQAAWKNATIAPGMKDAVIAANLKTRAGIAEKMFEKSRGEFIRGGYPMVNEAFPSRSTRTAPTQAQVDKMDKGTRFIGSDGKEYVKD